MKIVQDNAFSSLDAGTWPTVPPRNLPGLLRDGLRDAYASALSEHIPDELARCLAPVERRAQAPRCRNCFVGFRLGHV